MIIIAIIIILLMLVFISTRLFIKHGAHDIDDMNNVDDIIVGDPTPIPDTYPYEYMAYAINVIHKRMKTLSEYKFNEQNLDYNLRQIPVLEIEKYYLDTPRKFVNVSRKNEVYKQDVISNYFTEPCRVRANILNQPSVYDWWIEHQDDDEYKIDDVIKLRQAIYKNGPKQLTNFKPSNLVGIIDLFNSTSILDFSSGWGDRLAGAMAKKVQRYVGVDPNPCLHPYYKKMISALNTTVDIEMIESPFETAVVTGTFDLIFTSPPYFNFEIYSDEAGQSDQYDQLQTWYDNFLMFSLKKSWDMLEHDGIMAININDFGDNHYVQNMIRDVNKYLDSIYEGIIVYSNEQLTNPQPIWIWRKTTIDYPTGEYKHLLSDTDDLVAQSLISKKEGKRSVLMTTKTTLTKAMFKAHQYGLGVILRTDYNPPLQIEDVTYNDITFKLVQESKLQGGTKLRAMFEYILDKMQYDEFVYAGLTEGFHQIALAYVCWRLDKAVHIFTNYDNAPRQLAAAQGYGATHDQAIRSVEETFDAAQAYADADDSRFLLPENIYDDLMKELLKVNLSEVFVDFKPKRLWLTANTGVLFSIISELLPDTQILLVKADIVDWIDPPLSGATVYESLEEGWMRTDDKPPYKTILNRDGKMWSFIKEHGQDGDYIFNSGGI